MLSERSGASSGIRGTAENAVRAIRNFFAGKKLYELVVTDSFDEVLDQIGRQKGLGKRGVIRRALASYVYIQRQLRPDAQNPEKHLVIREGPRIVQRINLP